MAIASIVLSVVLAAVFLFSGARKIGGSTGVVEEATHLGVPLAAYRAIGVTELAGAAGLVIGLAWMPLGIAAAAGLIGLMVGALVIHLRAGDRGSTLLPAAALIILVVVSAFVRIASA